MKNYERTESDDNFDVLNFWKGEGKSYPRFAAHDEP